MRDLDALPMALALLDHELHLANVSPALAELTGALVGEHPMQHVADVLPGGAELVPLFTAVRDTGVARLGVERRLLPDLRVRISCYPIRANELVVGVGCVFEPAPADGFRDQVLGVVAHELREPLAAMMLWVRALRDDGGIRDRALEAIHESAVAQSRLIDDLIDIARAKTDDLEIDRRPVTIEPVLALALERIAGRAAVKRVTLGAIIEPGLGDVLGDGHRLGQILENLLANAVSFTEPGGRIEVSARQAGPAIEIVVSDSGRGLSPEHAARLFEPFGPRHTSATRPVGSLGVGLAIARELVELHRGTLSARSAGVGRGTSFTLTLPAATLESPRSAPPVDVRRETLHGVRVLVVDDHAFMREALEVVLHASGAIVECVASAETAWRQLLRAVPDLVISDVAMLREDGHGLARRIRATAAMRDVAMVALTANASKADAAAALAAGFDLHVAKPVDFDDLIAAISTALASRRAGAT
jgi:signal transduction histidine kinase/CheY-like chemotaxis protein